jgi:hypothetical protein
MSIVSSADFLAQIAGFTLGGVVAGLLGSPHLALVIDAATFLAPAGLVRRGIGSHRPAVAGPAAGGIGPASR